MAAVVAGAAAPKLGHRPGLDQLRGCAVLIVVVGHSANAVGLGWYSGVGVDVFFVLSGFLITRLLVEEQQTGRIDLPAFYRRRARRLFPALGAALMLCALVNVLIGAAILGPIASAVTYSSNYVQATRPDWGGSTRHLWSLAVEEHFYLVWPVIVVSVAPRRLFAWCVAGATVVLMLRVSAIAGGQIEFAYRASHLRADGLLVGAALAVLPFAILPLRVRRVAASMAGAAIGWLFLSADPTVAWSSTVVHLSTVVLIVAAFDARPRRLLERVGHLSYGIYLYHGAALVLAAYFLPPVATVAVALPFGFGVAVVSRTYLEERWLRPKELALEHTVSCGVDRSTGRLAAH